MRQRSDNKNGWVRKLWQVYTIILTNSFKEALCAPVFIFTSVSSALLVRPRCCLSIWLSLLAIFNIPFWVYVNLFHEKTDKTRKYVRKALILRASLKPLWFGSILEWAQAIVILGLLTFQVDWNTFSVTTVSRYIYKQSSPSPPEKKTKVKLHFFPFPFLPPFCLIVAIHFVSEEKLKCTCDVELLRNRKNLLMKYIDGDAGRELQALYALQAFSVLLDHPPGEILCGLSKNHSCPRQRFCSRFSVSFFLSFLVLFIDLEFVTFFVVVVVVWPTIDNYSLRIFSP